MGSLPSSLRIPIDPSVLDKKGGISSQLIGLAARVSAAYMDLYNAIMYPSTPCFLAYLSTTASNVTGDGTTYQVIFDTELYDKGDIYDISTGLFTAPFDGIYTFNSSVLLIGMTSNNTRARIYITGGSIIHRGSYLNPYVCQDALGCCSVNVSSDVILSSGQTTSVSVVSNATDKGVDVFGYTDLTTHFSGHLIRRL